MDFKEQIFTTLIELRLAAEELDDYVLLEKVEVAESVALNEVLGIDTVRKIHQEESYQRRSFPIYRAPASLSDGSSEQP